jgi:acyl-coenzyme A thioesterase PaaI-like protein
MTTSYESGTSIQERYLADVPCFGCGPKNLKGLRLRSFEVADGSVRASFQPWPEHDNGLGSLNGGIIVTLLDCHSAAAVVLASMARGLSPDGTLQYVTAGLDVRFLRPAPLREPAELMARLASADEHQITVDAELWWQGKVRATAGATWKRWRPRDRPDAPPTQPMTAAPPATGVT